MNTEAHHLCKSIMNSCNIDLSKSSFYFEDGDGANTVDASCFAASDTKSSAVQTDRKVRNKTTTTEEQLMPKIERKIHHSKELSTPVCDIHAIITLNVVARNADDRSSKGISVEPSDFRLLTNESTLTAKKKGSKKPSKCTCTLDEFAKKGACIESCKYSCKYGGHGPCNAFSIGTADYRMLLREKCNTMLIGGCRVPVCRNFKNKF